MKITHFISHFPYPEQFNDSKLAQKYICSGGETAAYKLVSNLANLGHEITVVTSSLDGQNQVEKREGFTVFRYGSIAKVGYTNFSPGMLIKAHRDIKSVDIVHIHHTTPPGGIAGLYFNRYKRKPLLVTHHGFEKADNYGGILRRFLVLISAKYYVDFLLKSASRIICINKAFINQSLHLHKYLQKTVFLPNGVDLGEFNNNISKEDAREKLELGTDMKIVLFVGTLFPPKGADVLIRSAKLIVNQIANVRFIFVGQGSELSRLKKLSNDLSISENIIFQGYESDIGRKNLFYRSSDVLVIPSVLSEMFPLVFLEGSAAGCAIITSDLELFKGLIQENENGLITIAGDEQNLSASIIRILQDPLLQSRLSQNAHKRALDFSWLEIAKQTEALYSQLMEISV